MTTLFSSLPMPFFFRLCHLYAKPCPCSALLILTVPLLILSVQLTSLPALFASPLLPFAATLVTAFAGHIRADLPPKHFGADLFCAYASPRTSCPCFSAAMPVLSSLCHAISFLRFAGAVLRDDKQFQSMSSPNSAAAPLC